MTAEAILLVWGFVAGASCMSVWRDRQEKARPSYSACDEVIASAVHALRDAERFCPVGSGFVVIGSKGFTLNGERFLAKVERVSDDG